MHQARQQVVAASLLTQALVQFEPKVLGYLRFLQESKLVFDCLEGIVSTSQDSSRAFLLNM